ncbi:unnamed protein product [Caenorhabditis brenneri]
MGGSNSKNNIFDENPKNYIDVPGETVYRLLDDKNSWEIHMQVFRCSECYFRIDARRLFPDRRKYECVSEIIAVNKYHLRRKLVIREVKKLTGAEQFRSKEISSVSWKPKYNQFNFQFVAYAIIESNGLRKLNFEDADVFGKSTTVLAAGEILEVPVQFLNIGAPFLAEYIDEKKPNLKLIGCSEEFFQVFHGVHVQLKLEEIKTLLKFSAKFQVLNVKKYCEQQLIRREDLKVSEKRKFKMACKFNLNILMNQVLMNVKSLEKLAKLVSIAMETESMNANISKLMIAKMYNMS